MVLLPEQVRDSFPETQFHINAGVPRNWIVTFDSAPWQALTPGLEITLTQKWLPIGETVWQDKSPDHFISGTPGKGGNNLARSLVIWDGREMDIRISVIVNTLHSWGISIT